MGPFSLGAAAFALAAVALPGMGKYIAIGVGILAIGTGIIGWRRGAGGRARARLAAAAGVALGVIAVLLGATKLGLTLVALDRLSRMFSD